MVGRPSVEIGKADLFIRGFGGGEKGKQSRYQKGISQSALSIIILVEDKLTKH
jgi:hypothetical protein